MAKDRIPMVQEMILSDNLEEREIALNKLLPLQQNDFYGILKAMDGFAVTIRLLDPPLHEFLPNAEELAVKIVEMKHQGASKDEIRAKELLLRKVRSLAELNPMLGHRGCRLGISYPEIYRMQARAIFLATAQLVQEGYQVHPEVEVP